MEPHPVPQNIIDVEFKLFGAFSLKQFGKILIGCMAGVVIYFIPFIPFIVKLPLIFIAVASGLLSAIIPNFGTWMAGFVKALIIAPRYVWVKEPVKSDILETSKPVEDTKAKSNADSNSNFKEDIENLLVSDALQEKEDVLDDFLGNSNVSQKDNFSRLYDSTYESIKTNPSPISPNVEVTQNNIQNVQITKSTMPIRPSQEIEISKQPNSINIEQLSIDQILKMIEGLKSELNEAVKKGNKQQETDILNKINDLYNQYKILKNTDLKVVSQNKQMQEFNSSKNKNGKIIFGIVVSKGDKPVSNATVAFQNIETKEKYVQKVLNDGKFATSSKIPFGNYDVTIQHPQLKFHTYRIDITENRLPAFKFREK